MMLFTGDPRIFISENGASLKFSGGQSIMDAGLENAVIISLFTKPDYWGNLIVDDSNKKIGSDFEEVARLPVTISNLNKLQRSAENALKWMVTARIADSIEVTIGNPDEYIKEVSILVTPFGSDNPESIVLSTSGKNWQFQASNPAYLMNGVT